MRYWGNSKLVLLFVLLLAELSAFAQDRLPPSVYKQAANAFQQGKVNEAEQFLRAALRKYPRSAGGLGLLGVILDSQKRYEEAEQCYTQAVKLAPGSAALYLNFGNHYLVRGMSDRARAAFLRVVALEPHHLDANLQLAQISVKERKGQEALRCLARLSELEQKEPAVQLLKAQALYWNAEKSSAESLLARLEKQFPEDPRLTFSIGLVFFSWERFEDAERYFSRALEASPSDRDILFNLAISASRAGHFDRAEEIFRRLLRQKPEEADYLYGLARVLADRAQNYEAVALLLQAKQSAPARSDISLLLAQLTGVLEFFGDAATAYDQYLKLRPEDDTARRERGYALVRSGRWDEGVRDLQWFVQKYPKDPTALYELAIAEMIKKKASALAHLDQAVELAPASLDFRLARAMLHFQESRGAEALADLKMILQHEPANIRALDLLGRCYLQLGEAEEAASTLQRATQLAPQDPSVLFQYSRALRKLGRKEEMQVILARFEQLGFKAENPQPRTGLFDYFSLPTAEQQARYLEYLRKLLAANPKDAVLTMRLGKELFAQGKDSEAVETLLGVRKLTSDGEILAECGRSLIDFARYEAARPFLEAAAGTDSNRTDWQLDLALAVFHTAGPESGLKELDKIPASARQGDFFLLRAQILDALGRFKEAVEALNRGLGIAPTRPDLYFQAALLLIKHDRYQEALDLLRQANRFVPDTPELLLMESVALELLQKTDEAKSSLAKLQSRWPEWELPYLFHGIIAQIYRNSQEARPLLETAIALGCNDPYAYYFLALAMMQTSPDDAAGVERIISRALELGPNDPYILALAGKNALSRKNYTEAVEHLTSAVSMQPDLLDAYWSLSHAYRALGEKDKLVATVQQIERLNSAKPQPESPASPVRNLLFTTTDTGGAALKGVSTGGRRSKTDH